MRKLIIILVLLLVVAIPVPGFAQWVTATSDNSGSFQFDDQSIRHIVNKNGVAITQGVMQYSSPQFPNHTLVTQVAIRDEDYAYLEGQQCVFDKYGNNTGQCEDQVSKGMQFVQPGTNRFSVNRQMVRFGRAY